MTSAADGRGPVILFDVGKRRYRMFGRTEACWIPQPELAERFID